ncbi:hypothetical protein H6775_01950 [Candidatus Nomurabacteria bacterium]|nr:hypothetical protein [Candidatus Nomurabacteria bacterium]
MNKNFLQDVVPPNSQKRSIRDIPLPTGRNKVVREPDVIVNRESEEREEVFVPPPTQSPRPSRNFEEESNDFNNNMSNIRRRRGSNKKILWSAGVIALVVLVFVILNMFGGAEVTIIPKQAEAIVNETINAVASDNNDASNTLVYKTVELKEEASENVKATGEENVETKASGTITIYNNHTTDSQPLVKNTRFESPDGLIYRIDKSVTVPGKTTSGQPGTIDVEVFADDVGEKYNIGMTDFTIPGFKDTPQFDGFSAKSKTEMTGGFKGVRPVVSESDFQEAVSKLQDQLTTKVIEKAGSETSEEMIALYDSSAISFSAPKQAIDSNNVNISITGSLNLFVFDKSKFSNFLASEVLTIFNQDDNVYILDPTTLEIKLITDNNDETSDNTTTIEVSGKARFVWENDNEILKQDLAGKNRKELKNILQDFNGIAKAEAIIRPFWKTKFPDNVEKITVIEKLSEDQ